MFWKALEKCEEVILEEVIWKPWHQKQRKTARLLRYATPEAVNEQLIAEYIARRDSSNPF